MQYIHVFKYDGIRGMAGISAAFLLLLMLSVPAAAQYADEINIMKDGRSFALGTPQEIFKADIIHEAFDCPVHIMQHPQRNCPLVIASLHEEPTGEWPSFQAS